MNYLGIFLFFRLCVTKLDILDTLPEIKIAVNYKKNGKVLDYFPSCCATLASIEVCNSNMCIMGKEGGRILRCSCSSNIELVMV